MTGRPQGSLVRDRLVELLAVMKEAYGYALAKQYNKLWAPVTTRLVYYHLHKGVDLELFQIKKQERIKKKMEHILNNPILFFPCCFA